MANGGAAEARDPSVSLKIPAPKHFCPKGRKEDTIEFETFSQQLKAYLSMQTRLFKISMNKAEQNDGPIDMPHARQ